MTHSFLIRAVADPQTLPRVIDHLGRRSVTPTRLEANLADQELLIHVEARNLSESMATIIGGCLRSCVLVHDVVLHRGLDEPMIGNPFSQNGGVIVA